MSRRNTDDALVPVVEEPDLSEPIEVLNLLKDAILRKGVDKEVVGKALRQVLENYEAQNRVFLIAAANAELPRVVKLLSFLNDCEKEMFQPKRLERASVKELVRMYALAQTNLLSGLDNVKKVADMRLDIMRAMGGEDTRLDQLFDGDTKELNALSGLPGLDATGREKVRNLMSGLVEAINKDDSISVDEEYEEEEEDESSIDDTDD